MDFGKLSNIDDVDFSLPPEPAQNTLVLNALSRGSDSFIYIGATGYNMKQWVGRWYNPGTKEKDFLRAYGLQFNTIEHNTTHYRIPDAPTVARWREETPGDFRFCPKIPQTISHARDLGLSGGQIPLFCEVIGGLAEKLGCCFLQLPPNFSTRDLGLLSRFLEIFPSELPLAVEVRHESFFKPTLPAEDYFQLLQHHRRAAVITDVSGRRDVCHMRLTAGKTLIRFVGNGLHKTDYQRINDWSARIKTWMNAGLREVYFFTHEPDNLLAPELAVYCNDSFSSAIPGSTLRGPQPVSGQQGTLF